MNKKDIKKAIYIIEMTNNGLWRMNGGDVLVRNIREKKDHILADVMILCDGEEDGLKDVKYPKDQVEQVIKRMAENGNNNN